MLSRTSDWDVMAESWAEGFAALLMVCRDGQTSLVFGSACSPLSGVIVDWSDKPRG